MAKYNHVSTNLYIPICIFTCMNISINKELEDKFRQKAMDVFGYKKGSLTQAIEEAFRDWLDKNGKEKDRSNEI